MGVIYLILGLVLLYLWYRKSMSDYWKFSSRGITDSKPYPFLGCSGITTIFQLMTGKMGLMEMMLNQNMTHEDSKLYEKRGWMLFYFLGKGEISLLHPELIKEVCVKKFDCFVERSSSAMQNVAKHQQYGRKSLNNLSGEDWKAMRATLSPSFTTGKLKPIVRTMGKTGPKFQRYLEQKLKLQDVFEMRQMFAKFTMNNIAEAVFSIDAKILDHDEDTEFEKNAKKIFNFSPSLGFLFRFVAHSVMPSLAGAMKLPLFDQEGLEYFHHFTGQIIQQHEEGKTKTDSMLQVLMEKTNEKDDIEAEDIFEKEATLNVQTHAQTLLDKEGLIDSAILFFSAGFETVSTTASLVSYYLATNPDVQEKLFQEIDAVAKDLEENILQYHDLNKLTYLEMVIQESMRLSPPIGTMERVCTRDCVLSNGLKIDKGTKLQYFNFLLHYDPKYWPDPRKFDPERFSKENKSKIIPYTYLPFGIGPRNCIGMRFAMMKLKVAFFYLLQAFSLQPSEKTPVPIQYNPRNFFLEVKGGNHLKLVPRT